MDRTLEILADLTRQAGAAIMTTRAQGFTVTRKADQSPLTEADLASNRVIAQGLAEHFPDIPVVSEETPLPPHEERAAWPRFFLVDPLDGTKEFIKDNGEFCVCLALIEAGRATLGAVYVPVQDALYAGGPGLGAFVQRSGGSLTAIRAQGPDPDQGLVVVGSRSHPDPRLDAYLEGLFVRERLTAGSALKFCMVAEGRAHLYPRFNPTSEWDTAAGQAVVEGAGGRFTTLDGRPFRYNKPDIVNPGFLVQAQGLNLPFPA